MTTTEYMKLNDVVNENDKYKATWSSRSHHKIPERYTKKNSTF